MQPVVMLVILVVAAAAMGAGFLNNAISLNVQQLGVGEKDLESPVSSASVDLKLQRNDVFLPGTTKRIGFENVIKACSFHSVDPMVGTSTVICKLTNKDGLVIAEGSISLTDYPGSITQTIDITDKAFPGANDVRNVHDVTIVILGQDPTP